MSSGAAAPSNPLGCRKIKTSVHKFYPKKKDECTTVRQTQMNKGMLKKSTCIKRSNQKRRKQEEEKEAGRKRAEEEDAGRKQAKEEEDGRKPAKEEDAGRKRAKKEEAESK